MFFPMSHYKIVLTEALIYLEASASRTNEKDFVVRVGVGVGVGGGVWMGGWDGMEWA